MKYSFNGNYSASDEKVFQQAQEEDLRKICKYLETDISIADKISFQVFDSREKKQKADPHHSISRASARFNEMTIYRVWTVEDDPHFPHETTHLVTHTWSRPYIWEAELDTWDDQKITRSLEMVSTSFMQEGLAIAVDDLIFRKPLFENGQKKLIDDWCRHQIENLPQTIQEVMNFEDFADSNNQIVVPFAASLSKFLLKSYGVEKYKTMYVAMRETNSPQDNVDTIEDVYGFTENALLSKWKGQL